MKARNVAGRSIGVLITAAQDPIRLHRTRSRSRSIYERRKTNGGTPPTPMPFFISSLIVKRIVKYLILHVTFCWIDIKCCVHGKNVENIMS